MSLTLFQAVVSVGCMKKGRVFIVGAARTPIGSFMGKLSSMSAPQLGAIAIKEAVRRTNVHPEGVQEVIMGMVLTGGAGQAPARQAAIFAGLPKGVPCTTVNKVCGSGLKAVMLATSQIQNGECDVWLSGFGQPSSAGLFG